MEGLLVASAGKEVRTVKTEKEAQAFKNERDIHVIFEI